MLHENVDFSLSGVDRNEFLTIYRTLLNMQKQQSKALIVLFYKVDNFRQTILSNYLIAYLLLQIDSHKMEVKGVKRCIRGLRTKYEGKTGPSENFSSKILIKIQ